MRLLIQRVRHASVVVEGETTGAIGQGLLVFVGLCQADSEAFFRPALDKLVNLRIFSDEAGKMNRSLLEVGGGLLLVSQFTLYADARKGRRPSYTNAMPPAEAEALFNRFVQFTRANFDGPVGEGRFGAFMEVSLLNDGPVTIWLDSAEMSWD